MDNVNEKELKTEQVSVQGATAQNGEKGTTEISLGKFKSVDALLDAYNSLEAEFTRRSQRLKELEGKASNESEKSAESSQNKIVESGEKVKISSNSTQNSELTQSDNSLANVKGQTVISANGNGLEEIEISNEVRNRIISQYFSKIRNDAPNILAGGGGIVGTPKVRAKTLQDAAERATEIFKKNIQGE